MAAAALMLLVMSAVTLTGCDQKQNKEVVNNYGIFFDGAQFAWTGDPAEFTKAMEEWLNSISKAYQKELGVTSDKFSITGISAECDKEVAAKCKKAEAAVSEIHGGSVKVFVTNETTGTTPYTYQVQ